MKRIKCEECEDRERFRYERELVDLERRSFSVRDRRSLGMLGRNVMSRKFESREALIRCLLVVYVFEAG